MFSPKKLFFVSSLILNFMSCIKCSLYRKKNSKFVGSKSGEHDTEESAIITIFFFQVFFCRMCPCVVMLYNDTVFFCRKRTLPTYYSVYMFNLLAINVCSGDPSMLQKLLMDDTFIYHYKKRGGALDSAVGTRFSCSDCHFLFLFLSICKSNFRHQ